MHNNFMRIKILSIVFFVLIICTNLIFFVYANQICENNEINFFYYSQEPDWVSETPHYSTGGALADINNDGWLDLVVADGNDMSLGQLNVYYNNNGLFPTIADWQSNDLGYNGHIDVSDVNGDGWQDVAVSYLGTAYDFGPIARVYLNNDGILSSNPDWTSNIEGNAFDVKFGDVNNDGRPDLAVATGWSYSPEHFYHNYVYINLDGQLENSASWISDDMNHYQGIHWIDADNDGWLDLAFIGKGQETKIYKNYQGSLETSSSWQTSDSASQDGIMLTSGDTNSNGIRDLFATDNIQLGGSGLFKRYNGISEGFFETNHDWQYYDGYGSAVALADINNDNKLDLATGAWWDKSRIFTNNGSELNNLPSWNSSYETVIEKIIFGDVGPNVQEYMCYEQFNNKNLFYLSHQPIQDIIDIKCDGIYLDNSDYTFSREHGWITVNCSSNQLIEVNYTYSKSLDMIITNWDNDIGNFLYYHREQTSDLKCEGKLEWSEVNPGDVVTGSFNVYNVGYSDSFLNWTVESFPNWGNWSISPFQGYNLTPEQSPINVNVELLTPNYKIDYHGEIKIINIDNPNDFEIIQVDLDFIEEPKPILEIEDISGGLGVKAEIKNIGDIAAYNIEWDFKIYGGMLGFINFSKGGFIDELQSEDIIFLESGLFLGLGEIKVELVINCDNCENNKYNWDGRHFIIFTMI